MQLNRPVFATLALLGVFLTATSAMSAAKAFPPTPVGTTEFKTLPAGRILEARSDGSYFSDSNDMFRPLFRYISRNDISMTTPVEAKVDPGVMRFWVAPSQVERATEGDARVTVIDVPERLVAAHGARGGYSESNYRDAETALLAWLDNQPQYKALSDPFPVFWDGPFKPGFMKRFEVQIEVEKK